MQKGLRQMQPAKLYGFFILPSPFFIRFAGPPSAGLSWRGGREPGGGERGDEQRQRGFAGVHGSEDEMDFCREALREGNVNRPGRFPLAEPTPGTLARRSPTVRKISRVWA